MRTFTVTGIKQGERWAGTFEATDFEDAERAARVVVGSDLLVAAIIEPDGTVHTAGYPPSIGPGTNVWEVANGSLLDDPSVPPVVGQYIYVPYHGGSHPSVPDCLPGLATVHSVTTPDRDDWMVTVQEHPGWGLSWKYLAGQQHQLHEDHRYEHASAESSVCPDRLL